jgi:hypothetical protein
MRTRSPMSGGAASPNDPLQSQATHPKALHLTMHCDTFCEVGSRASGFRVAFARECHANQT